MSLAVRRPALFTTRRSRTIGFGVTVVAVAVAAARFTRAEPTGLTTADAFWSAALVAVAATFGATARRWTWFLPAGVAAALAGDGPAAAAAAVAIVIAFVSVLTDTRSRARGALVVGLGAVALLRTDAVGFHGLTAILSAAALTPAVISGYRHAGKRVQRRARRLAVGCGAVIGLMLAGALLGTVSVAGDIAAGGRAIDGGLAAARDADDDTSAQQFSLAARSLATAENTLSSWFVAPAETLPIVGPNLHAVGSLAAQASDVADVSSLAASDADVDALQMVDGRLDPAAVEAMLPSLTQVRTALHRMDRTVAAARSPWLLAPVSTRIDRLDQQIDEAVPDADAAINAVGVAPQLLGADTPQRYLVLFTTPVEARGRFGFPGNFAEIVLDDGRLSMPRFGRIAELEQGGVPGDERVLTQPADLVSRYSRFDVAATWRNLTMSPDLPSLALAAAELYPQSGGAPIDGVMTVDPYGLAALMELTGEVTVEGLDRPLTADYAAKYLLFDQYQVFAGDNEARTDALSDVAHETFDRLTRESLPSPRLLSETFDPVVDGGHIQFATTSQDTFYALFTMGISGIFDTEPGTDTVTLTTANAGGSKIDLYLERSEQYDVTWDPATGKVDATLAVTLKNNAPAEGLPDYVIGNAVGLPPGTNRSFVSVYSPFELVAARRDGSPILLQSEVEAARNVYSTFVDIPPGGSVRIELDLTGAVEGRYRLNMPVQPFATPDRMTVTVTRAAGGRLASRQADVTAGTAQWSTTLDRERDLTVSAPR
ncbi:MAG TPA: DUF4012 domain-containing protein [Acidimicrobiales bacterium]|nr:DUF4012 domain-containing protein [Acidimicrobiales bacterium]